MRSHPSLGICIMDLASLTGQAFNLAMTPRNILSGFECTGIFPLNPDIFSEQDYLPADVTDRPAIPDVEETREAELFDKPTSTQTTPAATGSTPVASTLAASATHCPSTPDTSATPCPSITASTIVTPVDILPFPKTGPRNKQPAGDANALL